MTKNNIKKTKKQKAETETIWRIVEVEHAITHIHTISFNQTTHIITANANQKNCIRTQFIYVIKL